MFSLSSRSTLLIRNKLERWVFSPLPSRCVLLAELVFPCGSLRLFLKHKFRWKGSPHPMRLWEPGVWFGKGMWSPCVFKTCVNTLCSASGCSGVGEEAGSGSWPNVDQLARVIGYLDEKTQSCGLRVGRALRNLQELFFLQIRILRPREGCLFAQSHAALPESKAWKKFDKLWDQKNWLQILDLPLCSLGKLLNFLNNQFPPLWGGAGSCSCITGWIWGLTRKSM